MTRIFRIWKPRGGKPEGSLEPSLNNLITTARGGIRITQKLNTSPHRDSQATQTGTYRVRDLKSQVTQLLRDIEVIHMKENVSRVDVGGITGEEDLLIRIEKDTYLGASLMFICF